MYDNEITQALNQGLQLIGTQGASLAPLNNADSARPYIESALRSIVSDLDWHLGADGMRAMMAPLIASGLLDHAVRDLFGPCRTAAMLYARGEWSVVSSLRTVRTRGLLTTTTSIGRSLFTNLVYSLPATVADRVDALIKLVRRSYIEFGVEIVTRLHRDRALLANLFGVGGGVAAIEIQGSDPHVCARRVVIVRYGNGVRVVYKPTDLTFQLMLMGSPQSFAACAQGHPRVANFRSLFDTLNMGLPLLHIGAPKHNAGYGYMEFKPRAQAMTEQQASRYFHGMGKLIAVANAFGITDLHQENVMATVNGPFLIDAEMGFSLAPNAAPANTLISHTKLEAALGARPPGTTQAGGMFAPDHDPNTGWEAQSVSLPGGGGHANSGAATANGGGVRNARTYALFIALGIVDGVDGVAAAFNHASNWLMQQFDRVNPLARVILTTSTMVRQHVNGVTEYLRGTLIDEPTAINGNFMNWTEWYGGAFNAVPAAFFPPRDKAVMYDPRPKIGVTTAAAAVAGVHVSSTQEVRIRLATTHMGGAIARTKADLQTALEAELQIPRRLQHPERVRQFL
ncbi:DUF4135 domain-containing protein [Sorangium sp. So ce124]|uniref:DUF4135 domain-containing protein n=1 Tax=Sorangium sp. So ce124 TaxID=3133280 RepID=UPI003F62E164